MNYGVAQLLGGALNKAGTQVFGYLGTPLLQPGCGENRLERHPTLTLASLPSLCPYLAVLALVCPCPTSHLHPLPYKSRNVSSLAHSLID